MNVLDAAILVGVVLAAIGGFRLGFVARVLSWIGLGVGLALAVHFVPDLMTAMASSSPRARFLAGFGFVAGLAVSGQALGLALGALVHRTLPLGPPVWTVDRMAGASVGGFGVIVFVWMLIPALASAAGWPARAARGSAIVHAIESVAPEPPSSLEQLGRMVAQAPFPEVLGRLTAPPQTGTPPAFAMSAVVDARVRASVVRVEGRACDEIQDGSGFVVETGVVVTNAHVVAGERRTTVYTQGGGSFAATVVVFDSGRDLAVLRVPGLTAAPLSLAQGRDGMVGAVYGHPGGGPLAVAPARIAQEIEARGTDIYRTSPTEREVFVLAAQLAPGYSGGPLVNTAGQVVGVAFAIDPGAQATSYALAVSELDPTLAEVPEARAPTGACLVG